MAALQSPQAGAAMNDEVTANKRRSRVLVAAFFLSAFVVASILTLLIGALLGVPAVLAVVVAVLVALGATVAAYRQADAVALRTSRAAPAPVEDYARYHNIVEGLCIASGLPKPRLYVIEDQAPNAFATGRNPRTAALAVTSGLLDKLNRIELEGVVAHELSHVKSYDVLVSTLAVTMVGVALLGVPSLVDPVMARVVGGRRETLADLSAVEMTRYPPGLISALEKLGDGATDVHARPATAHLWIEQPSPPIEERIALLREL
ncbi:MAG TPA: M48 family metalloprotease [Acidimicrobiales bacterium]|nr:M48 family metalloprotease [Acidimicrobiales bacterium]